jgi:hypothetical protein
MCKVADLNPNQLETLHAAGDHETRNQLANRAGAIVTNELRRLWKDRQLKVRFSPDAHHLDTFISDPGGVPILMFLICSHMLVHVLGKSR